MFMLVDYRRWWSGAPFLFVGKNSILIYCGSVILQVASFDCAVVSHGSLGCNEWALLCLSQNRFPFSFSDHSRSDHFTGTFMTHAGALISNIIGVTVWCAIAFAWHRHGFFVKV
jgi:hypothetical protein